jgi:hypothetical protein
MCLGERQSKRIPADMVHSLMVDLHLVFARLRIGLEPIQNPDNLPFKRWGVQWSSIVL